MIALKNMKDKSYEEFLEEALAKIPLYYREWTSYHPSDPGITMLENLSAFSALKRQEFSQVTEDVQFKLLRLAGFSRGRGTPSRCLLSCKDTYDTGINLPRGQKIYVGDVCFETEDEEELYRGEITGVYVTNQGKRHCLNALVTEYGIPGAQRFSGRTQRGEKRCIFSFQRFPPKRDFFPFMWKCPRVLKGLPFRWKM